MVSKDLEKIHSAHLAAHLYRLPPPSPDSEQLEEREVDTLNPGLLGLDTSDATDTKETANEDEDNAETDSEKGKRQGNGNEQPRHAGFWHHDMVNVRLHVLHLWCRTGKRAPSRLNLIEERR